MLAWHFVGDLLRDGRPVPPDGEWLVHVGNVVLCERGLHASERALDALQHAPGPVICRVELAGEIVCDDDKLVASQRKIRWRYDATSVLRAFGRRCALSVVNLWDCPDVVRRWLATGDESLRDAAKYAVSSAAWSAGISTAWSAARFALKPADRAAAESAIWSVNSAAVIAADYAADSAARSAARSAADWDAIKAEQARWLEEMLEEGRQ